jgi:predicted adenylyl cyclase CyaB
MIECEVRALISEEQYNQLVKYFQEHADETLDDEQETWYFNAPYDLRTQKNNHFSKIWLKKGKIHDDAREELEITFKREDFNMMNNMLETVGFSPIIQWLRKRKEFDWKGIKVSLDHTQGYGYSIELEKLTDEKNKDTAIDLLRKKLQELGVEETSKEEFNNKYEYYKTHWRQLIHESTIN